MPGQMPAQPVKMKSAIQTRPRRSSRPTVLPLRSWKENGATWWRTGRSGPATLRKAAVTPSATRAAAGAIAAAAVRKGFSFMRSDQVEDGEQYAPDQGHEVPVGAADLDRQRAGTARGHEADEPDHPHHQVEAVQPGEGVEVGAELARAQGLPEI